MISRTLTGSKSKSSWVSEHFTVGDDRPYLRAEIAQLVNAANSFRDKAIILLLSSSGLRVGGLAELRLKHIKPVLKYSLYMIEVYKQSKEHYVTFCTPGARKAIDEYLDWRGRVGERLTPESPLFRQEFSKSGARDKIMPITVASLKKIVSNLRHQTAVVQIQHLTESIKKGAYRSEIKTLHGFRKYFASTLKGEGDFSEYAEKLMVYDLGLRDVYSKPTAQQLLEGNGERVRSYLTGINALTIDDAHRLRDESKNLKETVAEWAKNRKEMEQNKQEISKLQKRLEEIDRVVGATTNYS